MRASRAPGAVSLVLSLSLCLPPVQAQEIAQSPAAVTAFRAGQEAFQREEFDAAIAQFKAAIAADPHFAAAHCALGQTYMTTRRYSEAVASYRDALAINAEYPEAHFYLAVTLEKLSRSAEARPHWKAYCELAPEGEFVKLAREFQETQP